MTRFKSQHLKLNRQTWGKDILNPSKLNWLIDLTPNHSSVVNYLD